MNGAAQSPSTAVAASSSPRLSHKTNAVAQSHKSAWENPSSSSPSSTPRFPRETASPTPHKARDRRPHGDRPLVSSSPRTNGHEDSEAETEILSEDGPVAPRPRKPKTDDRPHRPRKADFSEPSHSQPNSRRSSMTGYSPDQKNSRHNGPEASDISRIKSAASKPTASRGRPPKQPASDSSRAQSVDPSLPIPPSSSSSGKGDAAEKSQSADPRKRKLSEENSKSKLEPPRQRPRLDTARPGKTNQSSPSSPALPHSATHVRSTSGQSNPPKPPARKTREFSAGSQALKGREKWADNFSDGDLSPPRKVLPPVPSLQPPRLSKVPQRALISPARATAHVRRADKYGTTPLAKACEKGMLDAVRRAYEQAPEELDQEDNGGFTPLQKAALYGHVPVVKFLLDKGCRIDCCSKEERDTPLIDAVENDHLEVVRLLLNSGVNPHSSNIRGNRAIDSIEPQGENAREIKVALLEAMSRHQVVEEEKEEPSDQPDSKSSRIRREKGLRPDLLYSELSKGNLLKYSTSGDVEAVGMMLESVPPDNACVVAAARGGHDVVLNLLLASGHDGLEKDPDPARHTETPLVAAIGRGHLKVIQLLLDQDNFNPCRTTREGKTYYQLAEDRHGPRWQTEVEMLKKRYDAYKSAHKARMLQKHAKTKSAAKLQTRPKESLSPKSPTLTKAKPKAYKEDESKPKRLLLSRESQNKDPQKSRRLVVDDESSGESVDDAASLPSKPQRLRTNSSVTKSLRTKVKDDRSPPSSPLLTEAKGRASRKLKDRNHVKSEDMEPSDNEVDKQSAKTRRMSGGQRSSKTDPEAREGKEAREAREVREKRIAKRARVEAEAKAKDDAEARERSRAREAEIKAKEEAEARERARQAEIKAREEAERLRRIQEEKERLRREREDRLASLPLAIRHAMERGKDRPLFAVDDGTSRHGIADQFLPIYVYPRKDIVPDKPEDPAGQPAASADDELWMMSFAAVGILGLPELRLEEFPAWAKLPVTESQRRDFLKSYDISSLAQDHAWPQGGTEGYDHHWTQAKLREAEEQFLALEPLWWIRLDDCAKAVRARDDLTDLKLRTFALRKPVAPIDDFWSTFPGSGEPAEPTMTPAMTPKKEEEVPGPAVEKVAEILTNGDVDMHVDEAS